MKNVFSMAVFMLGLVALYLVVTNARGFTTIVSQISYQWNKTIQVLQGK
jgi:hypothetical protein